MAAHPARWASEGTNGTRGDGLALAVDTALSPSAASQLSIVRQRCPERDRSGPSAFAVRVLGNEPHPAAAARRFTASTLHGWGMDALADDLAVTATELVTNAVRYGVPTGAAAGSGRSVWMSLVRQGFTVLCAVHDPGVGVPVVREPDHLAESGRGLHVVMSLSDTWGWTAPGRSGKAVWAVFSLPDPPAGADTV